MQRPADKVLTRAERLERRATIAAKLNAIKAESMREDFGLGVDEKRYLKIVIDTLTHLINSVDHFKEYHSLWCAETYTDTCPYPPGADTIAPIHLENYYYTAKDGQYVYYSGDELEDAMITSLQNPFFTTYENVKNEGKDYLKIYCSKMNSYCIDGRTREAYEYGYKFGAILPFSDLYNLCLTKVSTDSQKKSYSWMTAALIQYMWERPYNVDKGDKPLITTQGFINREAFGLVPANPDKKEDAEEKENPMVGAIDRFLRVTTSAPSLDFIEAANFAFTDPSKREVFIGLMLSLPEFKDKALLRPLVNVGDKKLQIQLKAQHSALQAQLNDFFIMHFGSLVNLLDRNGLTTEGFSNLLKSVSSSAIIELWKKNPYFTQKAPLKSPEITLKLVFECLLEKIKVNENSVKTFFSTLNESGGEQGGITFLHYLTESNNPDLIRMAIETAKKFGTDLTKQKARNGDTPLMYAARLNKMASLETLMPNANNDTKFDAEERLVLSKSLLIAAKAKNWAIVEKLAVTKPDFSLYDEKQHHCALDYAALDKQILIIEILLENGANINQVDPTATAEEKQTVLEKACIEYDFSTINTLLMAKDLDLAQNDLGIKLLTKYEAVPDLLHLLLTHREMPIEATVEKMNSSPYFYRESSRRTLHLFLFIQQLADPDYMFTKPIYWMHGDWATFNKIFSLYLATRQTDPEANAVTYWVASTIFLLYSGKNFEYHKNRPSFAGNNLESTFAKYNKLFLVVRQSIHLTPSHTLGSIRQIAKGDFDAALAAEQDPEQKKAMLALAGKAEVFNLQRDSGPLTYLFKSSTDTQKSIQAKQEALQKELKDNAPTSPQKHGG